MLLLMLILVAQNDSLRETEDGVAFSPITAGNKIYHGPFTITIPEGALYASEEYVSLMFGLMHVEHIPGCVGMFTSDAANWDFAVSVQYVPSPVLLIPDNLTDEQWAKVLTEKNLLDQKPVDSPGEIIIPPTLDPANNTFDVGVLYTDEDHDSLIVMKKVWAHSDGGLILTLRAVKDAFDMEQDVISRMFTSVEASPADNESIKMQPESYLTVLGLAQVNLSKKEPPPSNPAPIEEEPPIVDLKILGFGLGILVLAIIVVSLTKKKTENH